MNEKLTKTESELPIYQTVSETFWPLTEKNEKQKLINRIQLFDRNESKLNNNFALTRKASGKHSI